MDITRDEAKALVAVIVKYLEQQRKVDDRAGGDDPQHWDDAASWCQDILTASGRNDWGGCPLCRS